MGIQVSVLWRRERRRRRSDHAWDAISIDNGSIALEFAYVQEMGLPPAVNLKSFSGTICGHPASCPCSWMPQT